MSNAQSGQPRFSPQHAASLAANRK